MLQHANCPSFIHPTVELNEVRGKIRDGGGEDLKIQFFKKKEKGSPALSLSLYLLFSFYRL